MRGLVAVLLPAMIVPTPASPPAAPAPACWQPTTDDCGFPVAPGRAYTIGASYQATSMVRAVAYTYSAAAGWRRWFTGTPYGRSASWAPLATTTPAVPPGTERVGVDFPAA